MMKKNFTEVEASEVYGPSVAWFRRKRWEGDGPQFIKLSGMVLYPIEELEAYFASRLRKSTSDPGPTQKTLPDVKQTAKVRQICKGKVSPSAGLSHEQGLGGAEQ
jgi:hypothetical protein